MKQVLLTVPLVLLIAACDPGTEIIAPEGPEATFALSPTDMDASALMSELGNPVPPEVIVSHNELEWVWASSCADGAPIPGGLFCDIDVGHDRFEFATETQWANRPLIDAFGTGQGHMKCAAPWFNLTLDHCDWGDAFLAEDDALFIMLKLSSYGSAAFGEGGTAGDDGYPMAGLAETWLVREPADDPDPDPQSKNDCKKGDWDQFGFKNQGQCVRFMETGKDSR